jgi:radical SAM family protein/PDZ domain-containing protein
MVKGFMFDITEPRIEAVRKELERILTLVQMERGGETVEPDGFRLRSAGCWKTGSPSNAFEALGPLSGACDARCVFCVEQGVPFKRDASVLSLREAETRLMHFSAQTRRGLFASARPYKETFLNPNAIDILMRARRKSPQPLLIITTNGARLTDGTIAGLSALKPVLVKFSVNSTVEKVRRGLTGLEDCPDPCRVMEALRQNRIPFIGSTVAWPTRSMDELTRTLNDIHDNDPFGIRVRLPLVHKFIPSNISRKDLDGLWNRMHLFISTVAGRYRAPLWIEPVQLGRVPILPIVDGVILNSPAMRSGIRTGDRVLSIAGRAVAHRSGVRKLFDSGLLDGVPEVEVGILRNGETTLVTLEADPPGRAAASYPYDPLLYHPGERLGMMFLPDFDPGYLDNVVRLVLRYAARNVLLFCSPLTSELTETLVQNDPVYSDFFRNRNLWIYQLKNGLMGGNTDLTESRFVGDYETAFGEACSEIGDRPDLILIPDSFGSAWGIDFTGRSVVELQYATGIPVERIPWHQVYGRED